MVYNASVRTTEICRTNTMLMETLSSLKVVAGAQTNPSRAGEPGALLTSLHAVWQSS